MLHLRIVAPAETAEAAVELLQESRSVCNVAHLAGVAVAPEGDLVLADVAREDASVILEDLKALDIERRGAITVQEIDVQISESADRAVEHARGAPSDAVVWEEVESRTSEATEFSASFLVFMLVATLIAGVGIYLDSSILIVGAMVVGPEFGPLAGFCVAVVARRGDVALRSFRALAIGFPLAIASAYGMFLAFKATGITADSFSEADHELGKIISSPDFFAFFVAASAGVAGVLSLTTAKSGALIGVLISVTTIPAAANIGLSAAYSDWASMGGSALQLGINFASILVFGTLTLTVQRLFFDRRRRRVHREMKTTPNDP